jgi:Aminoglycoside/hydroxyurea antibiotic resistance kinase
MHDEPLPAMLFPSPSNELMQQASADAPRGQLWSWMQALPRTIQQCLSRWQIEWTGESLKQGYFGYVLPCRCQDGTHAILKLSPLAQEAQEQVIALSGWTGCGAAPLLAESFEENGAALRAGNLLLGSYDELVAIDPTPALGEPEQDIGDAAAKNDWGQELATRVKHLAEACNADPAKVEAYARLAAWNSGIFHTATRAESPGGRDPDELLGYACTESAWSDRR